MADRPQFLPTRSNRFNVPIFPRIIEQFKTLEEVLSYDDIQDRVSWTFEQLGGSDRFPNVNTSIIGDVIWQRFYQSKIGYMNSDKWIGVFYADITAFLFDNIVYLDAMFFNLYDGLNYDGGRVLNVQQQELGTKNNNNTISTDRTTDRTENSTRDTTTNQNTSDTGTSIDRAHEVPNNSGLPSQAPLVDNTLSAMQTGNTTNEGTFNETRNETYQNTQNTTDDTQRDENLTQATRDDLGRVENESRTAGDLTGRLVAIQSLGESNILQDFLTYLDKHFNNILIDEYWI